MQFKELGSLFNGSMFGGDFATVFSGQFKGKFSISDMDNLMAESFKSQMKINADGVSEYTMAQIQAKAAAIDLTDSLTTEAVAMASDADLSAKAATGKLTYGKAIKDNIDDAEELMKALESNGKLTENDLNRLKMAKEAGGDAYKNVAKGIVESSDAISDSIVTMSSSTQAVGASLGAYFKGFLATLKAIAPAIAAVTIAVGTLAAVNYATHGFTRAQEDAQNAAQEYNSAQTALSNLNSQYDEQKQKIEELQALKSKGTITMSQEVELENLQNQNTELERQIELQQNLVGVKQSASAKSAEKASNTEQSYMEHMQEQYGTVKGWFMGAAGYLGTYKDIDGTTTSAALEWEKENKGNTTIQGQVKANIEKLNQKKEELVEVEKQLTESGNAKDENLLSRQETLASDIEDITNSIGEQSNTLEEWISQSTDANGVITKGAEASVDSWRKTLADIQNIGKSQKEIDLNNLDTFFSSSKGGSIESMLEKIAKSGGSAEDALAKFKSTGLSLSDIDVSEDGFKRYFEDIAKSANEAADVVNKVNNNLTISDIGTAFESKNAGDNYVSLNGYLKKAKELYDQGLVGTDDFKTVAEAISYNIDSSTESFKANYDKLQSYFTEDDDGNLTDQGINNFLTDLQNLNKGYATWDENNQKWTLNMDNTAQAAKDMGLSVQSFESILGRIQDYDNVGEFKFTSAIEEFNEAKDSLTQLQEVYDSMGEGKEKEALGKKLEQWTPLINQAEDDLASLPKEVVTQLKFEYDKSQLQQMANDATEQAKASGWGDITTNANAIVTQENYKQKLLEGVDISSASQNKIPIYFDAENAIANLKAQLGSGTLDQETTLKVQAEIANLTGLQNDIIEAFQNAHPEITPETDPSVANATFEEWIQSAEGKKVIANVTADNKDAIDKINELTNSKYNGATINVDADTSNAKSKIDGVLSNDGKTIVMDVDATTDEIQNQISNLENGQTLLFKAEVDGKVQGIEAIKDENGDITYTANIDGVERTVDEIKNEDGTITYHADGEQPFDSDIQVAVDYIKASQEEPETKVALLDYIKSHQDDPEFKTALMDYIKSGQQDPDAKQALLDYINSHQDEPSAKTANVNYLKGSQQNPNSPVSGLVNWGLGAVKLPNLSLTGIINWVSGGSGKGKLSGTAHINGTAGLYPIPKLSGRALAMGTLQDDSWLKPQWRTNKSETALTGEEGQELVVTRQNRWFTVGDKGAEFASIPAGSVVFDAKQTKELLSKGFTYSRGKSYLSGTSYLGSSSGGFSFGGGASIYNAPSYSDSTPKSSTASTKAVQQATQAATKATEDFFDFVEIYLDREKDITDKATDSIEDATNLADKMSANSTALTKIQSEISANQQAYNRYMAQVNSVGLSENYASQIRNGSLNIENITDENLKKQIDDYKKWYENAKECADTVTELQREEKKLSLERLEYIEDTYDAITKVHKSVQDINDSQLEYEEAMGFNNVSDSVKKVLQSSVDEQQKIYDQNLQRLTDYQNEFNSLVSNGYLKEGSEEYNEAKAQLNDFIKEVNESATALIEFQDKLNEVEYKKIQNLIDGFDRAVSKLDKWVSLQESRDNDVPESTYQDQIDTNNANIKENYNLRNEKLKEQALYDVNSKRYQELAEDINKIDEETLGLLADNEKLKNSIFELRFKPLDDAIEKYDKLSDELGDFYDLLNEDAFFTKQGGGTADLVAGLALMSQQIEVNKQKIADYRVGLDKLQESFDNGVISEKEFNEKSEEYISGVQNAAKANNSLSNSITDLYLKQIKAENDYLQESIDKHKELLNQRKESDAYEKKVKSQTKNINALKSQIQALEGTNNQQSQAELKRLRAQLQEAEDELTETRTDHQYDVREHGYNALSDSLNEMYKDTEYAVTHSAEKQQEVIQSMLNTVVSSYASAYEKINQIITNTGWIGSSDFNSNQDELNTQNGANNQVNNATQKPINTKPSDIANNTVTTPINSNDKVNAGIEHEIMQKPNTTNRPVAELKVSPTSISLEEGKTATIKASIRPTDAANKTLSWGTSNESVATCANGTVKAIKPGSCQILVSTTDGSGITQNVSVTVTKKPDPPKPAPRPSSGGDGIPRVGDRVTLKAGQSYFYDSWGTRPAGSLYNGVPNGVIIDGYSGAEYGGQSTMHGGFGVHIKGADGVYGDLGWVRLDQLEGYASGTEYVDKEKLAWTQENKPEIIIRKKDGAMLTKLNPGDKVMDGKMTENIWKLAKNYPNIMNAQNLGINLNHTIPDVEVGDRDASIVNHYDSLLTVNGNVDRDTLPELKQILKESYDYTVKNLVKDARLMGKHKSI